MGSRLLEMYSQADAIGGLRAKLRLAQLTRLTSIQAESAADTPESVQRFASALVQIRQEFGGGGGDLAPRDGGDESHKAVATRLRRHHRVIAELLAQRGSFLGELHRTVQRVTEASASALEVERASVWLYDDARSAIRCVDLFERGPGRHSGGLELQAKSYPAYFEAIGTERTIAAHDAHTDPRTSCFSEGYLRPLGINSMLDVPIWAGGKMAGVVCHEHTGPRRTWNADDETFGYIMGNLVALAIEHGRREASAPAAPGA